ncbi:hypothetical protein EGW08_001027 [Elysia chlorotica]|uniref:Orexin-A n=1 Tax=Elysia chlorotica TaxID=188477 RepID=A0A3S1CFE2_ELYCH|nr:hypothetical protein EGW08_001027 [Elysia chlorotica]
MNSGFRFALLTAAILLLTTPPPCWGGPCDCATCQAYSNQKSRCLCCVYHGVGGKRSVPEPPSSDSILLSLGDRPPGLTYFLTPTLARLLADKGAVSRAKDGGLPVGSRRWPLQPAGEAMTSHPAFQHPDASGEEEFGLQPVLAVKRSGQRDTLGTSGALDNFQQFLLETDSV